MDSRGHSCYLLVKNLFSTPILRTPARLNDKAKGEFVWRREAEDRRARACVTAFVQTHSETTKGIKYEKQFGRAWGVLKFVNKPVAAKGQTCEKTTELKGGNLT